MSLRDRLRSLGGNPSPSPPREAPPAAPDDHEETAPTCHSERSEGPAPSGDALTPALSQRERTEEGAGSSAYGPQNDSSGRWRTSSGLGWGLRSAPPSQRRSLRWAYPIEEVVEGDYQSTLDGPCFVVEQRYPISYPHGRFSLRSVLDLPPAVAVFWARDESLLAFDPRRAVFLDLETTGLAGGTGTYAFLVGLGQVEGEEFRLRQFFLREYGDERPLLLAVNEALAAGDSLVTFNGKCFDWPLLETRYVYSRMRPALSDPLHLDLLYPARRLWRHRLESCALGSLERNVLGIERHGDVPGWLIPSLYFQYLTERDARPLRSVFEHNRLDLLSLAALAGLFGQLGPGAAGFVDYLEGADHYGRGRALEEAGHLEESILSYERALQHELAPEVQQQTLARLSFVYKRLRQSEQAVDIWQRLVSARGASALWPCLELAKYYEHQARDYVRAEEMALRALAALELRWDTHKQTRAREELEHRLRRIRGKRGQTSPPAPLLAGEGSE